MPCNLAYTRGIVAAGPHFASVRDVKTSHIQIRKEVQLSADEPVSQT